MTKVILAEKPDQAKDYAKAFKKSKQELGYIKAQDQELFDGQEVIITWALGHLLELPPPSFYNEEWSKWQFSNLPMIPERYEFQVTESKEKQFKIVKEHLNNASEIIIATDCDREGENIARSIIYKAGARDKPFKRLWINSLVKTAVKKGFMNLQDANKYEPLFFEARSRQIGDWLVGMNASTYYSLLLQNHGIKETFSVGRVQSALLFLIYKQQLRVEQFKKAFFWEMNALTSKEDEAIKFKLNHRFMSDIELNEFVHKHNLQGNKKGTVSKIEKDDVKSNPPSLHNLSSIQALADKKWGYDPDEVLKTVQSLYQKKLLSYPRTDSKHITQEEFKYLLERVESFLSILGLQNEQVREEPNKAFVDDAKVKEHYAIIPTEMVPTNKELDTLNDMEKTIYYEVLRKAMGMFYPSAIDHQTNVTLTINSIDFTTKEKEEHFKGWRELYEEQPEAIQKKISLNRYKEGQELELLIEQHKGQTTPPKLYTKGQLITLMTTAGKTVEESELKETLDQTAGLGTQATRHSIISTLFDKNYVDIRSKKVHITKKGRVLCEAIKHTNFSKVETTAQWEILLKDIGQGKNSPQHFLNEIESMLSSVIDPTVQEIPEDTKKIIQEIMVSDHLGVCPLCKKGTIVEKEKSYGCSRFKEGCRAYLPKTWSNKKLTRTIIKRLIDKGKSNNIKGFVSKKNTEFEAKLELNTNQDKLELKFVFK